MANLEGQQLGNYHLLRVLGQGGFATVYLGEHIHLGTQAAVKVLNVQVENRTSEIFRTEARTIAHLEHPHIIRILDFGIQDGTPFLVMSYAPSGTLRHLHSKGTCLSLRTVVSYMKEIAPALQYAHEESVIHRDIKPENILLDRRNHLLLSDFGIALTLPQSGTISTQAMAGTAAYMAPEQIKGKPRFASDQYSLGIIIYEWLAGVRPFEGSHWEIMYQHMQTPPPLLHEKISSFPLAVEEVVLKALSKDPSQRFANVQDFATAFEQAVQHCAQNYSITSAHSLDSSSAFPSLSNGSTTPSNVDAIGSQTEGSTLLGYIFASGSQLSLPTPTSNRSVPEPDGNLSPSTLVPPLTNQPTSSISPYQTFPQNHRISAKDQFFSSPNNLSASPSGANPSTLLPQLPPRPLQSHLPSSPQQFPRQRTTSTKTGKKWLRDRRRVILFSLLLLFVLSGLIFSAVEGYFAFNTHSRSGLPTAVIRQTEGATSSPSISSTTVQSSITQLGCPLVTVDNTVLLADSKTSYSVSVQATDKSDPCLQGKPVHTSGITCRLLLMKSKDDPRIVPVDRLKDVNSLSSPLPNEVINILNFDPTTPQTQLCDAQGQGKWMLQVSVQAKAGLYRLIIITDWKGKNYNWSWIDISIQ